MGLETVHPAVLPRLNKRFTLEQFAEERPHFWGKSKSVYGLSFWCTHRSRILLSGTGREWAVKIGTNSLFSCGAGFVSLIPTRPEMGV